MPLRRPAAHGWVPSSSPADALHHAQAVLGVSATVRSLQGISPAVRAWVASLVVARAALAAIPGSTYARYGDNADEFVIPALCMRQQFEERCGTWEGPDNARQAVGPKPIHDEVTKWS